MNFFTAIFLWFFFGAVHSIMARPFFKRKIKDIFGNTFEEYFYRFFYFISQCILFYYIYGIIKNLDQGQVIFSIPEKYFLFFYMFNIFSNLFLIISILHFDVAEFIGFKQMINFFFKQKETKQSILNDGMLYKYIRHPMYLGIILVYLSSTTIYTELFIINLICIIAYIEIGSFYEEKTLIKVYGASYKIYKNKTFKYLPFIR